MFSFKELIKISNIDASTFITEEIALLSDQSSQFLTKCIKGYGLKKSLKLNVWESPINQIDNQILNPQSEFYNKTFNTIIVFESSHSLQEKYNQILKNSNDL